MVAILAPTAHALSKELALSLVPPIPTPTHGSLWEVGRDQLFPGTLGILYFLSSWGLPFFLADVAVPWGV